MKYIICQSKSSEALEKLVNDNQKDGYRCTGGVCVSVYTIPDPTHAVLILCELWSQAMVREPSE